MNKILTLISCILLTGFTTTARAADHSAEIDVSVTPGSIGSHFSISQGNKTVEIDGRKYKIPFSSDFTKIANRADASTPITPGKPWKTTINNPREFSEPCKRTTSPSAHSAYHISNFAICTKFRGSAWARNQR